MFGLHTEYFGEITNPGSGLRGQSAMWRECDLLDCLFNRNRGVASVDDFMNGLPTGKYTVTQATTGTFALADEDYGVAIADAASTTDTQGVNVQLGGAAGECLKAHASGLLFFETRIKAVTSINAKSFVGLAQIDGSLIAASALTSQCIGFQQLTGDGVILAVCKDGSGTTTASAIHTMVVDTYVNLGFVVRNQSRVDFYVNGVLKGSITANISTTELTKTVVCQSPGTVSPKLYLDWWDAALQLQAM